MAKAQGKEFTFDGEDHINSSFLETFPFESKKQYIVKLNEIWNSSITVNNNSGFL